MQYLKVASQGTFFRLICKLADKISYVILVNNVSSAVLDCGVEASVRLRKTYTLNYQKIDSSS